MSADSRRAVPRTDALLSHPIVVARQVRLGQSLARDVVRRVLEEARGDLAKNGRQPSLDELAQTVAGDLDMLAARRLRAVINATGVVLHTNLGRAPLSASARAAVDAAAGYCTVEFDLHKGNRGKRGSLANELLCRLTHAPAAVVVNNAAAALLLALASLASGREVIVSRGELIEIGGEFRLPAIMEAAGVRLVEVGTTNRTHLKDYAGAITERTALLLVVHTSNYRIEGFATRPPLPALVRLAHDRGLPVLHDVGSGLLSGTWDDEPTVDASLRGGADIVIFSGDKLFGGPQAGLIAGDAALMAILGQHPIARAVRIDKLTLAALEATLCTHLAGSADELPVWRALRLSVEEIRSRACWLAGQLGRVACLREGASVVGGGSMPGEGLPSVLVEIDPQPAHEGDVLARLRAAEPPVIARAGRGRVLIDLRTVPPDVDGALAQIILAALKESTT
jgi:L-seryl-tRNA(Ser) seleniumtransferase